MQAMHIRHVQRSTHDAAEPLLSPVARPGNLGVCVCVCVKEVFEVYMCMLMHKDSTSAFHSQAHRELLLFQHAAECRTQHSQIEDRDDHEGGQKEG